MMVDFSFPEELLGSSVLVTKQSLNSTDLPCKRVKTIEMPSVIADTIIPEKRGRGMLQSSCYTLRSSPVDTNNNNNNNQPLLRQSYSKLRSIQLELEKEKELYTMHTIAASKSFERINLLLEEVSTLMHQDSVSAPFFERLSGIRELAPTIINNCTIPVPNAVVGSMKKTRSPIIKNVSVAVKMGFFGRKPRCLVFPNGQHDDKDLFITSSLDGLIQYNSMKRQITTASIYLPSLMQRSCFAEVICPTSTLDGFIISTVDSNVANGKNLSFENNTSSLVYLPYQCQQPQQQELAPLILSPLNGDASHKKAISSLWEFQESNAMNCRILSGSLDRSLLIWEIDKDLKRIISTKEIHHCHTSAVQAMVQTTSSPEIIWSGGADYRLMGWSSKEGRLYSSHRYEHSFSYLLVNQHHPNNILATVCSRSNQLLMLDTRSPLGNNKSVPSFGHHENSTSRYIKPGWSWDGNLVAFGTFSPESRVSSISVWDIRYLGNGDTVSPPVHTVEFRGEKRFLGCEFWPNGRTIVAISTDCSASFIDFNTTF